MSGGDFVSWRGASAGVSPVREATVISGTWTPSCAAVRLMPASGARRLRSTSYVSAFSGLTYSTRTDLLPGRGSVCSRSRHHRNAARVLPEPVGAWMRVCLPPLIARQPSSWARVGPANASANQARVGSLKGARGSASTAVLTGYPVYRSFSVAPIPVSGWQVPEGRRAGLVEREGVAWRRRGGLV